MDSGFMELKFACGNGAVLSVSSVEPHRQDREKWSNKPDEPDPRHAPQVLRVRGEG
jgi:hypothetical protein